MVFLCTISLLGYAAFLGTHHLHVLQNAGEHTFLKALQTTDVCAPAHKQLRRPHGALLQGGVLSYSHVDHIGSWPLGRYGAIRV